MTQVNVPYPVTPGANTTTPGEEVARIQGYQKIDTSNQTVIVSGQGSNTANLQSDLDNLSNELSELLVFHSGLTNQSSIYPSIKARLDEIQGAIERLGNDLTAPTVDETSFQTASVAPLTTTTTSAPIGIAGVLYQVTTSLNSWVRVYSTIAAMNSDIGRINQAMPGDVPGLLLDITTSANVPYNLAPAMHYLNLDNPYNSELPVSITNIDSTTGVINVLFVVIKQIQ